MKHCCARNVFINVTYVFAASSSNGLIHQLRTVKLEVDFFFYHLI